MGSGRRTQQLFLAAALLALPLAGSGCETPVPILHDRVGQVHYLRCNMRTDGPKLYSANYSPAAGVQTSCRPGTEATVTMYSEIEVQLTVNGLPYKLYPVGGRFGASQQQIEQFFDKYFVQAREELGLEAMPQQERTSCENGVPAVGLTKEQIYMAIGPPAVVGDGQIAVNLSREDIMRQNRWVYFTNSMFSFWFQQVLLFDSEGKLIQVQQ